MCELLFRLAGRYYLIFVPVASASQAKKLSVACCRSEVRLQIATPSDLHSLCKSPLPACLCVCLYILQWELDLHGLHVGEALTALQERVELLQDLAGDLRKQVYAAQHHQGVLGSSTVAGDTRRAVLTSLFLPDGQGVLSWEQQLAAMRQELRVIVGKGSHSRGGEASLPRVVEQWLLQHGFKHTWRGGCIGVQLKLL